MKEKFILTKDNQNDLINYIENLFENVFCGKNKIVGILLNTQSMKNKNTQYKSFCYALGPITYMLSWGYKYYQQFNNNQYTLSDSDYNKNPKKWDKIISSDDTCVFLTTGNYNEHKEENIEIFKDDLKNYGFNYNKEIVVINLNSNMNNYNQSNLVITFTEKILRFLENKQNV